MKKLIYKDIFLFLLIFVILFIINYFIVVVTPDEVWTYGFSYNITNGLLPYRDFNMVILPFHSFILALPMLLFGNSLLMWHLINDFIFSIILFFCIKKIGLKKGFFLLLIMITFEAYFYNVFLALLLISILLLEESNIKNKNLYIGLLIGSIMMTKVNIGAFLFLVFFFKSNNKLRDFLYSSIVPSITLLYLIISNTLLECIDYCFLGIKNFSSNNSRFDLSCIIITIMFITYIIYKIRKTKDNNYYYFLAFMMMCYPICDYHHMLVSIFPLFFYLLLKIKSKYNIMIIKIIMVAFSFMYITSFGIGYKYLPDSPLLYRNFYEDFSINKYKYYKKYMQDNKDKRFFLFYQYSYLLKIDNNLPIDKYDLINSGNMGSDELSYLKEIDNICNQEDCRIIVNPRDFYFTNTQYKIEFLDYVMKNYDLCYDDFVYCKKEVMCKIDK